MLERAREGARSIQESPEREVAKLIEVRVVEELHLLRLTELFHFRHITHAVRAELFVDDVEDRGFQHPKGGIRWNRTHEVKQVPDSSHDQPAYSRHPTAIKNVDKLLGYHVCP